MTLPLPLRLALRELRGGLAGFRVFLACLALGVAAIAAVGSVRAAIEAGLARDAAALLGGDAEIELAYRFADPDERAWMQANALAVSEIVDFRSLAATEAGERTLVQVKAVDDGYPLYGRLDLGGIGLGAALAPVDGRPGLVAERLLVERLGLAPGDDVVLGTRTFRLAGTVGSIPDAGAGALAFGPRVIVRLADLDGSGLLAEGSLFDSAYRLRLAPGADLAALQADAEARFADRGLQWRDRRDGAPGVGRFVDRLGDFLILHGLAGLAVGGIGVAAAVRAHVESRVATIATLRTLGATGGTVLAVYLTEIGLLAIAGVAIGLGLGAALPLLAAPFAGRLPVPAAFGVNARPLAEAALYGLLAAFAFSLWPLARVRDIRPAALFRDEAAPGRPRPAALAATVLLAALLVAAALLLSGAPRLALAVAGGVAGALLVLALAARGLVALARRAAPAARGRPALRWALGALGGPARDTAPVVLALGLGLGVLAAVGQIDANLRGLVARDLPARAPAFFFVDIQNHQLEGFRARAAAVPGVGAIASAPMLRGVIIRIYGRPAREVAGEHWVLNGDRGVSYAAEPPPGTEVVEGAWWPADHAGPPLVSFAAEEGRELGLKLGDALTINVLGRDITATIASFRTVRFESMGIGFVMIVDPAALAGAPHTHIATIEATPEAEAPLVRAIAEASPNITAIAVRDGIARVATTLVGVATAARWAALATLSTGLLVLAGAAAAGERRRLHEAAVLKTLGASRARILASFALRAALTGTAAGLVAVAAGSLAGWAATVFVLDADFRLAPLNALAIVAGGALASLLAGLGFALRPLGTRPARVLRARE
ncbi:MAG TPA: FtsX-like permease family protein [Amaricoccus sp.]|nr:FtsX-like permease family protein [Amaricoccus sp.]